MNFFKKVGRTFKNLFKGEKTRKTLKHKRRHTRRNRAMRGG